MKVGFITKFFIFLINIYRKCISPLKPATCRFHPSCSEYGRQALSKHGFFYGSYLTILRILKCHPFYRGNSCDPVPTKEEDNKEN